VSVFCEPCAASIASPVAFDAHRAAAVRQTVYVRPEMNEVMHILKIPEGPRYGDAGPQPIPDAQARKRVRRYLTKAAVESADQKAS